MDWKIEFPLPDVVQSLIDSGKFKCMYMGVNPKTNSMGGVTADLEYPVTMQQDSYRLFYNYHNPGNKNQISVGIGSLEKNGDYTLVVWKDNLAHPRFEDAQNDLENILVG